MCVFVAFLVIAPPCPADLPPASDAWRFPPWRECQRQLTFNDRFREKLAEERRLWPENRQAVFAAAIEEAGDLRRVWLAAYYAGWHDESLPGSTGMRREYLADLRGWLGDGDYRAGRMPPAVPLWRFRELP